MEIKPEHEFFGRNINFDDIENIKKVFQPGILDSSYFFNPNSLNGAISELCGYGSKDILVYFNKMDIGIVPNNEEKERKWWQTFQDFIPLVKGFPAGCEMEYWYKPDGKEFSSPEFKEDNPPYQAFVRLFDNAIQGFSCFVSTHPDNIGFSSWRSNYETMKPGECLVHDKKTLWVGKSDVFLESAQILHNAFSEMERRRYEMERRKYRVGVKEMAGNRRREIRIIYPERGALVGSLYGRDSVALLVENSSLEKIVQPYMKESSKILC